MESPRAIAIKKSQEAQEKLKRERWRIKSQKEHRWEKNIGASTGVLFRRKDRTLIIKMFRWTLDDYFKHSKKSHWIHLECRWRNLGCKTGYDKKKDTWYPKKQK